MKNFNFKINNFYSIFNQMPEGKRNIDSYLNDRIKLTLSEDTSSDFTYELMKRVELEKEFAKEDVKTDRIVKYIIGGFISILTAFTILLTFVLNTNKEGKEVSYFNSIVDKFSNSIEFISVKTTEIFGFTFNFQTGIIIFLIMLCVFLFSFADKIIFRKTYK